MTRHLPTLIALLMLGCLSTDRRVSDEEYEAAHDAAVPVVDSGSLGNLWHCGCAEECHTDTSQPIKYCADRMALEWTVQDIVQSQCRDFHGVDEQCRCGHAHETCLRW